MADLRSPRIIVFKGMLFLLLGLMASAMLIGYSPDFRTVALLAVSIWAFCRFYYFAFYVIEKYVDSDYRFAGLFSAASYLVHRRWYRRDE